MAMFICTHVLQFMQDPLNNETFTEQQNIILLTTVGKLIFNEILPKSFPYINEPTGYNLEVKTPEKYFVENGARY